MEKKGFFNRLGARLKKIADGARALLQIGKPPEAAKADAAQNRDIIDAAFGRGRFKMPPGGRGKAKRFTVYGRKVRSALRCQLAGIRP